jgi:hypothetical protein
MKITLEMLQYHNACDSQLQKFEHLFPDGVEPTIELARKHADDFIWHWAARYLLDHWSHRVYQCVVKIMLEENGRVWLPARKKYDQVYAHAKERFKETGNQDDFEKIISPARLKFERIREQCLTKYHIALAEAFVTLFNQ